MVTSGQAFLTVRIVSAKTEAPPSARSSRVTEVITICFNFISWQAWATCPASPSGNAKGQVIDVQPMLAEYYALRGWDPERGWPTPEKLRSLGLADAVERLVPAGGPRAK